MGLSGRSGFVVRGCKVREGHTVNERVHLGSSGGSTQREGGWKGLETPEQRISCTVEGELVGCAHTCLLLIPTLLVRDGVMN
jgi:hypothetical protein